MENTKIAIFRKKEIRKTIHNNEWWFVVEDIVFALTDSKDPKQYIQKMKQRDAELTKGWVQIVLILEMATEGGPQKMNCANTEGVFRLIQSIPSLKAEPRMCNAEQETRDKQKHVIARLRSSRSNPLGTDYEKTILRIHYD